MSKRKGPRWQAPPDRWKSVEENREAADAFFAAAYRLIARNRPSAEWSEAETLGIRLATELQLCFHRGATEEWVAMLRKALEAFRGEVSLEKARYCAVRAIAEWAQRLQTGEWNGREDSLHEQCVHELSLHDAAFGKELANLPDVLLDLLRSWDPEPAGKAGKKAAETILATLIVDECDCRLAERKPILGFKVAADEATEDAIEHVRKRLTNAVNDYRMLLQDQSNKA